jgi:predicted ATPase/DNA-binding CsgD family transcriptional regulator
LLPLQPTPLVGRHRELVQVRELLLRDEVRLLTLVGAGGSGKTRLAVAVAADLAPTFEHNVVFVDLTLAAGPAEVVPVLARSLGLPDISSRARLDRIRDVIGGGHVLLVLDNFEHVLGAAPQVAELLQVCPALVVLATSRIALRSRWEHEYPVQPLALPDDPTEARAVGLADVPAIALFVQRAQAARPDFVLDDLNAAAVADICRTLDGLPLAIELAAVRTKLLPPKALLSRLGRRLAMLTEGPRGLPERQQTLRGAIAWSYDLLDADERLLFRRLSVFSGGCTEAQAHVVCGPIAEDGRDHVDVLEVLGALVDNSLLRVHEQADGEPRFSMLDTLREFAADELTQSGESEDLQRRHAELFMDLASEAQPRLASGRRQHVLDQLEADYDNLRTALTWLIDSGRGRVGCRMAGALRWFWHFHGRVTDGRRWLERFLALADAHAANDERALALVSAGHLAWVQGDYEVARRWLSEGTALARSVGNNSVLADGLIHLGLIGPADAECARLEEESLEIATKLGDPWLSTLALHGIGMVALAVGDRAEADARLKESLELWLRLGDRWFASQALNSLGDLARAEADDATAVERYSRSLELLRQEGARHSTASVLQNLGYVRHHQGDNRAAFELFREAIAVFARQGDHRGIAECLLGMGMCAFAVGMSAAAVRLFGAGDGLLASAGMEIWPANASVVDEALHTARTSLSTEDFARLYAEGRAMSGTEAQRFARELAPPAESPKATQQPRGPDPFGALTPREREIAWLLARGRTNRQIADELVISEQTAETHVKRILGKLDLRSRHQLAEIAGSDIPT